MDGVGFLPRHVWLVDEATNSRKPPLIALLLELRLIENDGPARSRAAEPHWRGLVAVAFPGRRDVLRGDSNRALGHRLQAWR